MTVRLGPNSPLLTASGARRRALGTPTEFDTQAGLLELLVGKAVKGRRRVMGEGMTTRIPSLYLIHALANGTPSSKVAAGRAKAEGVLVGMPDLHWPVARGPFIGLYLETKRQSRTARPTQVEMHAMLRDEGHAVVVYDTIQRGLDVVIAYDDLEDCHLQIDVITARGVNHLAWDRWEAVVRGGA